MFIPNRFESAFPKARLCSLTINLTNHIWVWHRVVISLDISFENVRKQQFHVEPIGFMKQCSLKSLLILVSFIKLVSYLESTVIYLLSQMLFMLKESFNESVKWNRVSVRHLVEDACKDFIVHVVFLVATVQDSHAPDVISQLLFIHLSRVIQR